MDMLGNMREERKEDDLPMRPKPIGPISLLLIL